MTMQIAAWGRLANDPKEISTTNGNTRMAVSTAAVDVADPRDEQDDAPLWLGVVAFGRQAEALLKHQKGDCVSVSGRVQRRRYQGQDGAQREQLQVVTDSLVSARTVRPGGGGKAKGNSGGGKGGGGKQRQRQAPPPDNELDDPIPW